MGTVPALVYRTNGAWGNGKGGNLTPAEVDSNFAALAAALGEVEAQPADVIDLIEVANNKLTIHTSSDQSFGPFALPIAAIEYDGDFVPFNTYSASTLITANNALYYITADHVSEGTFDPSRSVYREVMPFPTGYEVGFFYPGAVGTGLSTGDTMLAHACTRAFYLPRFLPGSVGKLEAATAAPMALGVYKNTTQIGSVNFGTGAAAATFSLDSAVQFSAGDVLRVPRPATIDSAARSLTLTFSGKLGVIP